LIGFGTAAADLEPLVNRSREALGEMPFLLSVFLAERGVEPSKKSALASA
jgi:hypothetical protein